MTEIPNYRPTEDAAEWEQMLPHTGWARHIEDRLRRIEAALLDTQAPAPGDPSDSMNKEPEARTP